MDVAAGIAAGLLGALYLMHGVMIVAGVEMQRENARMLEMTWDRYRLVALPELAAGAGLFVGIWIKELAAAAAFGLLLLMSGAALLRIRAGNESKAIITDVSLAVLAGVVAVLQLLAI